MIQNLFDKSWRIEKLTCFKFLQCSLQEGIELRIGKGHRFGKERSELWRLGKTRVLFSWSMKIRLCLLKAKSKEITTQDFKDVMIRLDSLLYRSKMKMVRKQCLGWDLQTETMRLIWFQLWVIFRINLKERREFQNMTLKKLRKISHWKKEKRSAFQSKESQNLK